MSKYPKRFFVSGYLSPVKDVENSFNYVGKSLRGKDISKEREDRVYPMNIMREQVKYDEMVEEVTKDTHKLEYVSSTFLKPEIGKARICINCA